MFKSVLVGLLSFYLGATNICVAASYSYIDPGDYYYVNRWDKNEHVVVVRKLGNGNVKVRNINTGATLVVPASKLLTKSELDTEETKNMIVGGAVIFCLLGGCEKK